MCVCTCACVHWGHDQIYILKRNSGYSVGYTEGYQEACANIQASDSKGRVEEMALGDISMAELIGQHISTQKHRIYT